MARYIAFAAEAAGYVLLSAGSFLVDVRLGLATLGLILLVEGRDLSRQP